MFFTPKRLQHFGAMILIGDGVMAVLRPSRDARAWKKGPRLWRELMLTLSEDPNLTRAIGAAQIAGGIWWTLGQDGKTAKND